MKFYLHICNLYQPSLSKFPLIWLGVISPKEAVNLTILFPQCQCIWSSLPTECTTQERDWIPTTNYLRMTIASISEKPVSSGVWKQSDRQSSHWMTKSEYSSTSVIKPSSAPQSGVWDFLAKAEAQCQWLSFCASLSLLKWHWSLCRSIQIFKEGFPFMI